MSGSKSLMPRYQTVIVRLAGDGYGADALNEVLAQWSRVGWRLHSHSLSPCSGPAPDALVMLVFVQDDAATTAKAENDAQAGAEPAKASTGG
jgi:hypothetical protein